MIRSSALFALAVAASAQSGGDSVAPVTPYTDHSWAKLSGEAREVRFEALTRADGIPADRIYQVLQDRRGFIWFTTLTGLFRWDGYESVRYPGLPLMSGFVNQTAVPGVLYEARDGRLWVATDVVTRFDPSTGKFGAALNPRPGPARPLNDAITGFVEAADGALWLGVSSYQPSPNGGQVETSEPVLYRLDPSTGSSVAYPIDPKIALGTVGIRAIQQDARGRLWLGTSIGLVRFDPGTASFRHFPHDHPGGVSPSDSAFNALVWDKTGHLWVHVPAGIERFDPETGVFDRSTEVRFRQMRSDPSGRIWLWPGNPGLMVFDPDQPPETALRLVPYRPPGSPAEPITFSNIDPDRQGNIWGYLLAAGTVRYSPAAAKFGKYLPDLTNPNSVNGGLVRSFAEDADGSVWIGTAYTGLGLFDPRTGNVTQFHRDPKISHGLNSEFVLAVHVDRFQTVWVATGSSLLGTFDRKTGRYRPFPGGDWTPARVYSLFEDSAGRLWASGFSGKTRAIDLRTGTLLPREIDAYVAGEDREGNLWFGFPPGLTKLDRAGNLRSISLPVPESSTLLQPQVRSIQVDSSGILWLGSNRGLFRFDPRTEKAVRYAGDEGLSVEDVSCVLPDDEGNLWLSTTRGISRFDTAARRFYNYDERDGLQPRGFARYSCMRARDGRLYFGGSAGFNTFYPRDILARAPDTHVVLTSLQVKGSAAPIIGVDHLSLPYNRNELYLEFAALNAVNPGNLRYRYRLEPQEQGWIETDSAHRGARYTGLSPGDYTFHSQVSIDGRIWSGSEGSVRITVKPPWWGTWWARAAGVLCFAGFLFGSYKVRVRALEERQRRLAELVDSRTAELAKARSRAEAANTAKSVFLASMSHELRNPLSAILGVTSLLQQEEVSAEQHGYLDMIGRSGEHLLAIINDVLDMAKIEAGKQELAPVPFDVAALAGDLARIMHVKAAEKNVDLSFVCAPEVPRFVRADSAKLRQVLVNLLGNALKFTDAGSVALRLGSKPEQPGRARLRFELEDTGRGISPQDQARIFEPFVQLGKPTAQKGTGLGLAITRQFVEMMGGTISVESAPGRGSCFTVEVPVEVANAEEVGDTGASPGAWLTLAPGQPEWRVLIVEDDTQNALVMEQMLRRAGFRVRLVERGAAAIAVFREWGPHFIWMDLRMPDMSGTETARRIRQLPDGGTVKIAAMTASAFASEREEVLAAGMDDFVRKPYRPAEIFDCLARHLPVRFHRPEPVASVSAAVDGKSSLDRLRAVPDALLAQLAEAVVLLDRERVAAAITNIERYDAVLANALRSQHERFAYTAMSRLIQDARQGATGSAAGGLN